jgi:hypothetical protein
MGAYPFVVVALLALFGAALVLMDIYNSGQSRVAQRTRVTAVAEMRNHQPRADHARSPGDQARAKDPRLEFEAEVKATEALAADAEALAAEALARAIRLRLEAEANAKPVPPPDYHRA